MSEIGSRPYPEPWGDVQKLVADPVWPGADECAIADLAQTSRASAGANKQMSEELFSHASKLEDHAEGSMAVAPDAVRELAKHFEDLAELDEKTAELVDASAVEVRELKVDLSVIGVAAQADQARRWEPLLRATGRASWAERLAKQSLEADMARARERAEASEATHAALRKQHTDLVGGDHGSAAEVDPFDDRPALRAEHTRPAESGQTQAMSASAPAAEHHQHDDHERHDGDQGDDSQAGATSAMAAPVAPMTGGASSASSYTPTSYGGHGSHHDAQGLAHAGASGLVDGEDSEQPRIDHARTVLARILASRDHSPYKTGSPVAGLIPPTWLALVAWYDADWQTRLHLLTGEGLGWVPPGTRVPEHVTVGELPREVRPRPAQSAAAFFPPLAREQGGRAALVCVASNMAPMDGDADLIRRLNEDNEDGWRREAVLTGAASDGGGEAGGFLCHRAWHADLAITRAADECPDPLLVAASVRLAEITVEASLGADDPALLGVVTAWRNGQGTPMGPVQGVVRAASAEMFGLRGQLAVSNPEDARMTARRFGAPASTFSAGVAVLLADMAVRASAPDLSAEIFYDVCYEYAQVGGDADGVRRAIALAGGSYRSM